MFLSIILAPFYIGSSMLVLGFQSIFVIWNLTVVLAEVTSMFVCHQLKRASRWIVWPWELGRVRSMWRLYVEMRNAPTYEIWLEKAKELDVYEGGFAWRMDPNSEDCDAPLIRLSTQLLRKAREGQDYQTLIFLLSSMLVRNYGGLEKLILNQHSRVGTKKFVEVFLDELCASIDAVATSDLPLSLKMEVVGRWRMQVGRSAMCLSGGGSLAMVHAGVLKTLIMAGLLPRVLSGTSGGSLVVAFLGLYTDDELLNEVVSPAIVSRYGPGFKFFDPLVSQLSNFVTSGLKGRAPRLMDSQRFSRTLRKYYGDVTFLEAFERTGRIINISCVARAKGHPHALLLNYLTSPQVLVWSAVAASCALPGLFSPATLMAKDYSGEIVVFLPTGVEAVDGSLQHDIPAADLAVLFQVQRLVVSQANPHVVPFLRDSTPRGLGDGLSSVLQYNNMYGEGAGTSPGAGSSSGTAVDTGKSGRLQGIFGILRFSLHVLADVVAILFRKHMDLDHFDIKLGSYGRVEAGTGARYTYSYFFGEPEPEWSRNAGLSSIPASQLTDSAGETAAGSPTAEEEEELGVLQYLHHVQARLISTNGNLDAVFAPAAAASSSMGNGTSTSSVSSEGRGGARKSGMNRRGSQLRSPDQTLASSNGTRLLERDKPQEKDKNPSTSRVLFEISQSGTQLLPGKMRFFARLFLTLLAAFFAVARLFFKNLKESDHSRLYSATPVPQPVDLVQQARLSQQESLVRQAISSSSVEDESEPSLASVVPPAQSLPLAQPQAPQQRQREAVPRKYGGVSTSVLSILSVTADIRRSVATTLTALDSWLRSDVQLRVGRLARMQLLPSFFGEDSSHILTQTYTGQVTIVARHRFLSQFRVISQPSENDMLEFIESGERAAWAHLTQVSAQLCLEKKLSATARQLALQAQAASAANANLNLSSAAADSITSDSGASPPASSPTRSINTGVTEAAIRPQSDVGISADVGVVSVSTALSQPENARLPASSSMVFPLQSLSNPLQGRVASFSAPPNAVGSLEALLSRSAPTSTPGMRRASSSGLSPSSLAISQGQSLLEDVYFGPAVGDFHEAPSSPSSVKGPSPPADGAISYSGMEKTGSYSTGRRGYKNYFSLQSSPSKAVESNSSSIPSHRPVISGFALDSAIGGTALPLHNASPSPSTSGNGYNVSGNGTNSASVPQSPETDSDLDPDSCNPRPPVPRSQTPLTAANAPPVTLHLQHQDSENLSVSVRGAEHLEVKPHRLDSQITEDSEEDAVSVALSLLHPSVSEAETSDVHVHHFKSSEHVDFSHESPPLSTTSFVSGDGMEGPAGVAGVSVGPGTENADERVSGIIGTKEDSPSSDAALNAPDKSKRMFDASNNPSTGIVGSGTGQPYYFSAPLQFTFPLSSKQQGGGLSPLRSSRSITASATPLMPSPMSLDDMFAPPGLNLTPKMQSFPPLDSNGSTQYLTELDKNLGTKPGVSMPVFHMETLTPSPVTSENKMNPINQVAPASPALSVPSLSTPLGLVVGESSSSSRASTRSGGGPSPSVASDQARQGSLASFSGSLIEREREKYRPRAGSQSSTFQAVSPLLGTPVAAPLTALPPSSSRSSPATPLRPRTLHPSSSSASSSSSAHSPSKPQDSLGGGDEESEVQRIFSHVSRAARASSNDLLDVLRQNPQGTDTNSFAAETVDMGVLRTTPGPKWDLTDLPPVPMLRRTGTAPGSSENSPEGTPQDLPALPPSRAGSPDAVPPSSAVSGREGSLSRGGSSFRNVSMPTPFNGHFNILE